MKRVFKWIIPSPWLRAFRGYSLGKRLLNEESAYLSEVGYLDSVVWNKPIHKKYGEVPWMNYAFIEFLSTKDLANISVLEVGGGNSTLFWAKRVKRVVTFETDPNWFSHLRRKVAPHNNVSLIDTFTTESFDQPNVKLNAIDMVIIDGLERLKIMKLVLEKYKNLGVIVFDDTHATKYKDAFRLAKDEGFKELTFTGLKPSRFGKFSTTLFYRKNNCLNL
jgi:hypothetical protein